MFSPEVGVRKLFLAAIAAALATFGGCATMRDEVISGFCGADPRDPSRWDRIEAPADADIYRTLARTDAGLSRARGDEYWFASESGEVKYCVTPLRRASTIPERNGSNCDDRIGWWWIFHQTPSGPQTRGVEERICLT